jgi:hypothetical protein
MAHPPRIRCHAIAKVVVGLALLAIALQFHPVLLPPPQTQGLDTREHAVLTPRSATEVGTRYGRVRGFATYLMRAIRF